MLNRILPQFTLPLRSSLNWLGVLILVAGLGSAAVIWRTAGSTSPNPDERIDPSTPLVPSDSRKQTRQIEIYYGKTGVLAERWREELEQFKSGKPLAEVVVLG